jgi:hypothetical protein
MKAYYHQKIDPYLKQLQDKEALIQKLRDFSRLFPSDGLRFEIYEPGGTSRHSVTLKTVERVIRNGHTDSQVSLYVNPQQSYVIHGVSKNGKKYALTQYMMNNTTSNWVMDIDDIPGVFDIDGLLLKFESSKCPKPSIIVQTGEQNFHCVYFGAVGEFSKDKRLSLSIKFANIDTTNLSKKETDDLLRKAGVDPNCIANTVSSNRVRVPGFMNLNHSTYGATNSHYKNTVFIIEKVWINKNYKTPIISIVKPTKIKNKQNGKKTYKDFEKYIPGICEALSGSVPDRHLNKVSEFFANNITGLKNGKCIINQEFLAKQLGIAQKNVSIILKKLIQDGFLIVVKEYKRCVRSRTYQAGLKLMHGFVLKKTSNKPKRVYDISSPYLSGETNQHYLKDIRFLCATKVPKEEALEIIWQKMLERPKDKRRRRREISKAIGGWYSKMAMRQWQETS